MNQDWTRWIHASVAKHFNANKQDLDMFVEGFIRDTRTKKDFFELRIDGPIYTELTKGYWRAYIEVNCLVQSAMDKADNHRIHRTVGKVTKAFTDIVVEKLGDSSVDDDSTLGCLRLLLDDRKKQNLVTSYFGQLEPSTQLLQASVEGHYEFFLQE